MTALTGQPEPYTSLDAVRRANDELIASLPDDETRLPDEVRRANEARVVEFVRRAVVTGTLLDAPLHRRTVQGLIDYWIASAYTESRDGRTNDLLSDRSNYQLKPFDTQLVRSIAERAEKVINSLGRKDQLLARRIMLSLFRLADASSDFEYEPVTRQSLRDLGDDQSVDTILRALVEAEVLKLISTHDGDRVELTYGVLERQWATLHMWLDERIRLRDAAMQWEQSGRKQRALLGFTRSKEAKTHSDLNELERTFVDQSNQYVRRRTYIAGYGLAGAAAVLLALGGLAYMLAAPQYVAFYVPDYEKALLNPASTPTRIAASIRWLAERGKRVAIAGTGIKGNASRVIQDIDLSGLTAYSFEFTHVTLRRVIFDRADIPSASLEGSAIEASSFKDANLQAARFQNSRISATTFAGSDLNRAVFNRSLLTDVDFSRTNVEEALFRSVRFGNDKPPNFTETAWWFATGWSLPQVDRLAMEYGREGYQSSNNFKTRRDQLERDVEASAGYPAHAHALNELAWFLATNGIDLATAKAKVEEALNAELDPITAALYNDTRAYILTQQGEVRQAVGIFDDALKQIIDQRGEVLFRYAVALHASGRTDEGIVKLNESMVDNKYWPRHELYQLRQFFTGAFRQRLAELTTSNQ